MLRFSFRRMVLGGLLCVVLLAASVAPAAVTAQPPPNPVYPGGPSREFTVGGGVEREMTFTLAEMRALPAQTLVSETRTRAGSQGFAEYRGVLLKDVLDVAGVRLNPAVRNDALSRTITVTGSDGYRASFAWGEIDPDFGAQPILVAYEMNGMPLSDRDGAFEVVLLYDKLAGRWVKNVTRIVVNEPSL